ncbi:MAG: replicative DNA helicase [bacterium]|nr:replicative DNA helicase [bacterium]
MATDTRPFIQLGTRIPPQDLTAEQALLGALMIKPRSLMEITDFLLPDHFYAEKHRLIYKAMLALDHKAEPIDIVSLTGELKNNKTLDQVGGASYLAEIINLVPSAVNLKNYADIVAKKAALRQLIESASHILELGYNEKEEIDTIFERAEQAIHSLTTFSKKTYLLIKDTLAEAWEHIDRLHHSTDELRGIPSGFRDLDNLLAGFQKSDLVIVAARPSVGKTSLALDFIRHAACRLNKPVAIFSLEMSSQQLVNRLIAAEARVDSWRLRNGKINSDEEFGRIRDAMDTLSKAPIFINDEPSSNIVMMRSVARRLKAEHDLSLIVVDYLQLMVPRRESDSMVQMVTEISRSLKGLARELDVPVIALSQLSRAVESRGGKPRLSDLRDSGSIEQDADVVMFIHREDKNNEDSERKNVAEILIEKHRNGPTGRTELYFEDKFTSFVTMDKGNYPVGGKEPFGGF